MSARATKLQPTEIGVFEAKTRFSELVAEVERGRTFLITKRGKQVGMLQPLPATKEPLTRGCAKNPSYYMAPDFDEPLDDFAEYM